MQQNAPNTNPAVPLPPAGLDPTPREALPPDPASLDPVPPPKSPPPGSPPPEPPLDTRRRRILFRATHRGTHETDMLIGGFVTPRIAGFSPEELDSLEELMELPDVDLADWLMGRRPIPANCDTPMLQAVLHAARNRSFDDMGR